MKLGNKIRLASAGVFATLLVMASNTARAEEYCREFTKDIAVGGKQQEGYGKACWREDGSWEIKAKNQHNASFSAPYKSENKPIQEVNYYGGYSSEPYKLFSYFYGNRHDGHQYYKDHHRYKKHYRKGHHYDGHHYKARHKDHHKKHSRHHYRKHHGDKHNGHHDRRRHHRHHN